MVKGNGDPSKIHTLDALAARLAAMRHGRRVVQCHGVFDLLHIGHIRHLREARALGDLLVVTVTPDRFVNKGPTRPAFGEKLRAEALAALDCVDYVAINDAPQAEGAIRKLRPALYVKGGEYRRPEDDPTGGIEREARAIEEVGGALHFTDDIVFSSSSLINEHLSTLPEEARRFLHDVRRTHGAPGVLNYLRGAQALRVVVVGEAIIDEYQYCEAIGKSSKEPMLTVRRLSCERFAGGILAVVNHLADFCGQVEAVSIVGASESTASFIGANLDGRAAKTLIGRPDAPTIIKRRYIDSYYFQKLFGVYEMDDSPLSGEPEARFVDAVTIAAGRADAVIVVDFGHGVMTPAVIEALCANAKFLAVNVQSNAGNQGYNTLSKYPRADLVCVTEHEARLDLRDLRGDLEAVLERIARRMGCPRVIATRGSRGAIGREEQAGIVTIPALTSSPRDRMGAGDAFHAFASIAAAQGAPLDTAALIAGAAAAQAVATVGHRQSVRYDALHKHLECLLK